MLSTYFCSFILLSLSAAVSALPTSGPGGNGNLSVRTPSDSGSEVPDWPGEEAVDTMTDKESDEIKEKFSETIDVKFGKLLSSKGSGNEGVYIVDSIKGTKQSKVVGKILPDEVTSDRKETFAEVWVLEKVKQLKGYGIVTIDGKKKRVILMPHVKGKSLDDLKGFRSKKTRDATLGDAIDALRKALVLLWKESGVLHSDNAVANVLFVVKNGKIVSANLIDFEGSAMILGKKEMTEAEVTKIVHKIIAKGNWPKDDFDDLDSDNDGKDSDDSDEE